MIIRSNENADYCSAVVKTPNGFVKIFLPFIDSKSNNAGSYSIVYQNTNINHVCTDSNGFFINYKPKIRGRYSVTFYFRKEDKVWSLSKNLLV